MTCFISELCPLGLCNGLLKYVCVCVCVKNPRNQKMEENRTQAQSRNCGLLLFFSSRQCECICFILVFRQYVLHVCMATCQFQDTLNEDIADNGGLRKAYRAFNRAWPRVGGVNATLPDLTSFTPEQLFFLGYATVGIIA